MRIFRLPLQTRDCTHPSSVWIKHSPSILPWAVAVSSGAAVEATGRFRIFQVFVKLLDNLVTQGVAHQAAVSRIGKKRVLQ